MNRSLLTRDCIHIRPIFGGYYRDPENQRSHRRTCLGPGDERGEVLAVIHAGDHHMSSTPE